MIIPTALPFNSSIWPALKLGKNEWCLMVDYLKLHAVGLINVPVVSIIAVTDFIQSATGKYFAIIDLVNMFCLVTISTASSVFFFF